MMISHDLSANHPMPLITSMLGERSCLCEWCFQVGQDQGFLALLQRNGQVFNGFAPSHVSTIDGFTIQDQMGDWWVRFACSSHGTHAKLLQTSCVGKAQSSIHSNHHALGHHPTLWIVPHISKASILHLATDGQVGHGHFVGQLQNGQGHPRDEAFLHGQAQRHQKGGHLSGWPETYALLWK